MTGAEGQPTARDLTNECAENSDAGQLLITGKVKDGPGTRYAYGFKRVETRTATAGSATEAAHQA